MGTTLVELFTDTELLAATVVWEGEAVAVGVIIGVLAAGCEASEFVRETASEDDIDGKDVVFCPDPPGELTCNL